MLKKVPRCVFMQLVSPHNLTVSIKSVTEECETPKTVVNNVREVVVKMREQEVILSNVR